MIEYKNAKEIFKEKGYEWVKGWVAELDKRNIKERTEREIEAARLVESWELVEYSGGINASKRLLLAFYYKPLAQAILDVESCQ